MLHFYWQMLGFIEDIKVSNLLISSCKEFTFLAILYNTTFTFRTRRARRAFHWTSRGLSIFAGKQLEMEGYCHHCRIRKQSTLNLFLGLRGGMQIFIKTFAGTTTQVERTLWLHWERQGLDTGRPKNHYFGWFYRSDLVLGRVGYSPWTSEAGLCWERIRK